MMGADPLRIAHTMKGFGIIGLAAIAGLIGYFCEPALRPVLTPAAKVPASRIATSELAEPAPVAPSAVVEPEKPPIEPQPEPVPAAPAVEAPAPVEPPVAEPKAPGEPAATPEEPAPAQEEEMKPEEPAPTTTGKADLPPVTPLHLDPPSPTTPPDETAEATEISPVIAAMQESFQKDGLKEFTEATPTRWQAGADETIKGETYQTGLLDYLAQTPFGGKAMQVKALLQDGKVVKWVSITSGKELK